MWLSEDRCALLQRRQTLGRESANGPRGWPSVDDYVVIMQNFLEVLLPRDITSLCVRAQSVGVVNRLGVTPVVVADIVAMRRHQAQPTQVGPTYLSRPGTTGARTRCDDPTVRIWCSYGDVADTCHNCGDRIRDQWGYRCIGCPDMWCCYWCQDNGPRAVGKHLCSGVFYLEPRRYPTGELGGSALVRHQPSSPRQATSTRDYQAAPSQGAPMRVLHSIVNILWKVTRARTDRVEPTPPLQLIEPVGGVPTPPTTTRMP